MTMMKTVVAPNKEFAAIKRLFNAAKRNKEIRDFIFVNSRKGMGNKEPIAIQDVQEFVKTVNEINRPAYNDHVEVSGLEYLIVPLFEKIFNSNLGNKFNPAQNYLKAYHIMKTILEPIIPEIKNGFRNEVSSEDIFRH